jgi:hypothetical protein
MTYQVPDSKIARGVVIWVDEFHRISDKTSTDDIMKRSYRGSVLLILPSGTIVTKATGD